MLGKRGVLPATTHRVSWDDDYLTVLVDVVEAPEKPERVHLSLLSIARLRSLHLCLCGARGVPHLSHVEVLLPQGDWEADAAPFLRGERWFGGDGHVIDDRIERRAQVVEEVPSDRAEVGRRLRSDFDRVDVLRSIAVKLAGDAVGVGVAEPLMALVEGAEVLFHAPNLELRAL